MFIAYTYIPLKKLVVGLFRIVLVCLLLLGVAELVLWNDGFPLARPLNAHTASKGALPIYGLDPYWSRTDSPSPLHTNKIYNVANRRITDTISGTDHMRFSRPLSAPAKPYRVLCLGCSYTFGADVNDQDTFVWRLNEMYANTSFDNAGLAGSSTLTDLLRLKFLLRNQAHYDLVLYFPICDQVQRSFSPRFEYYFKTPKQGRPDRSVFLAMPYAEIQPGHDRPTLYCHPALETRWYGDDMLRSVHLIKIAYNTIYSKRHKANMDKEINSLELNDLLQQRLKALGVLMLRMQNLCEQFDTKFYAMSLEQLDSPSGEWCWCSQCVPTLHFVDISYPLGWHNTHVAATNNRDSNHPDATMHKWYALSIARQIARKKLLPKSGRIITPGADIRGFEKALKG